MPGMRMPPRPPPPTTVHWLQDHLKICMISRVCCDRPGNHVLFARPNFQQQLVHAVWLAAFYAGVGFQTDLPRTSTRALLGPAARGQTRRIFVSGDRPHRARICQTAAADDRACAKAPSPDYAVACPSAPGRLCATRHGLARPHARSHARRPPARPRARLDIVWGGPRRRRELG